MAWTSYHDALLQEMAVLMTEPGWSEDPTITARLYGEGGPNDPSPDSVVGQISIAGADAGQIPKFEVDENGNPTGKIARDQNGNIIFESQEEGLASLLEQFETARIEGTAANERRYDELLTGYRERSDKLLTGEDGYGAVGAQLRTDTDAVGSAYGTRAGDINTGYETLASAYGKSMDTVAGNYGQREQDVLNAYDQYGYTEGLNDISRQYQQQRAAADRELQQRGLGNTTIVNSAMQGLNSRENQDRARYLQMYGQQRANLMGGLRGDTLGYQGQQATNLNQVGLQRLGAQQQATGDQLGYQGSAAQQNAEYGLQRLNAAGALTVEPLGVMERRTDTVPSLSDVANLATGFGRSQATSGFSMGQMGPTSYYQQTG